MKKLLTAIALAAVSASAFALDDVYIFDSDNVLTYTIRANTAKMYYKGKILVAQSVITYHESAKTMEHMNIEIIGCDSETGGQLAAIDSNGNKITKTSIWVWGGGTTGDDLAAKICGAGLMNYAKSKPAKTKTNRQM